MSISCKDLIESFKDFKVKAITMDANGLVILWDTSEVKYTSYHWKLKMGVSGRSMLLGDFEVTEFMNKASHACLYIAEEADEFNKWIGRVCWFWTRYTGEDKALGILEAVSVDNKGNQLFKDLNCGEYYHCRPAKLHEVKFVKED